MKTKNKIYPYLYLIIILFLCSCINKKGIIYSDNRYKPIKEIELNPYKSPQERLGQNDKIALGISISGGGSRAQYFGLGVLIGLDEIKKGNSSFLNEVDYYSTVSGGGFAAGYYLSLSKNEMLLGKSLFDFWKSDERKFKLQEYLSKSANQTNIFKLWGYERNLIFKPYPSMIDYELLQYGKSLNGKLIEKLHLRDFFISKDSTENVTMPMFVTNGTIYKNGERLPFMPHIIDDLKIQNSLLPKETFDIDHGYGLPLNYAIAGSAAFPGILPMLKFTISDDETKVIRVIDGGAVDNLGFKTLFQLLIAEKDSVIKKRALIVNCAGFGFDEQQIENDKIGIPSLLEKALLYTVDINLLNSNKEIPVIAKENNIDYELIGFNTLKEKFYELKDHAASAKVDELNTLRKKILNGKVKWEDLYLKFCEDLGLQNFTPFNLSEIPSDKFGQLELIDVFALYELSAQIQTKIKIYEYEREILILAGRYAVYLKELKIQNLLN